MSEEVEEITFTKGEEKIVKIFRFLRKYYKELGLFILGMIIGGLLF